MSATLTFENTYARDLEGLYEPYRADPAPAPELLALNEDLAAELGVDPDALRTREGIRLLLGTALPEGTTPIAQGYAGHQFGGYSPRLGDGRALLLGEVIDVHGARRDVHLKGSGRTPFSRGGDGKAVVGPMLREHIVGETMHRLGIPTTRALAVVATGEEVARETMLPGAVLVRVAASHLRVGTFQYARALNDEALLRRLADYAIARHHPEVAEADNPYLAFYEAVVDKQARLIAQWMHVGFIHGVMNTDNMTISGETIDYGPCAFMDAFDPETVYSSIDHGGRYAYGNQPPIAQWNLARLAEGLLPLIAEDQAKGVELAMPVLETFPDRYSAAWLAGMGAKLGLPGGFGEDESLAGDLLRLMAEHGVDYTGGMRSLSSMLRGDASEARVLFAADPEAFDAWAERWQACGASDPDEMDRVNPVYVPRNHLVEEALTQATVGDLRPFERLMDALARPFDERPGLEEYASPAPPEFGQYRTFCGT